MASVHLFFNKNDFKNNVFSFNKCRGDTTVVGSQWKKKRLIINYYKESSVA